MNDPLHGDPPATRHVGSHVRLNVQTCNTAGVILNAKASRTLHLHARWFSVESNGLTALNRTLAASAVDGDDPSVRRLLQTRRHRACHIWCSCRQRKDTMPLGRTNRGQLGPRRRSDTEWSGPRGREYSRYKRNRGPHSLRSVAPRAASPAVSAVDRSASNLG